MPLPLRTAALLLLTLSPTVVSSVDPLDRLSRWKDFPEMLSAQ